MNILGLHYGHDGAAVVVKDGKLVTAISAERVLRKKKFSGVTEEVINIALKEADISLEDVDVIALADYFIENSNNTLFLHHNNLNASFEYLFENNILECTGILLGKKIPTIIIPHHLAHCASAYYTSNYDKSWCFSMDSSLGDTRSNSMIAFGDGNKLTSLGSPGMMIGVAYMMFTELLGLGSGLFKAGSTMGLASYGQPLKDVLDNYKKYVNESYFDTRIQNQYTDYYEKIWTNWYRQIKHIDKKDMNTKLQFDIAASIQFLFEEAILDVVNNKIPQDSINNICLSGGSMLNCNSNTRVKTETRFKNVHHFPACGDDGVSVGAALYVAHHIYNEPRHKYEYKDICYLGQKNDYIEPDCKKIAKMISDGKIVAWFMGRSEYGPRALGNRSILADPRSFHNREILNFVVKNREWFRPFAPVVLEEECDKWFDFKGPSPYMLYTADVLQPEKIPGVTHIDNSARMQTINYETNPAYYNLVKEFYSLTGVPILINTSLNGKDEPILETKQDALSFFNNSAVDVLILNGEIYVKD
jgi:carbamoyltransferase